MSTDDDKQPDQHKVQRRTVLGLAVAAAGAAVFASRRGRTDAPQTEASNSAHQSELATATAEIDPVVDQATIAIEEEGDVSMQASPPPEEITVRQGPAPDEPIIVKWRAENVGIPFYPPTIADGKLYVPQSNGFITVLDAGTGALEWSESIGSNDTVTPPVVVDDTLYFSSSDRRGSSVQAINKDSKTELWRFTPELAGVTPVTIHDEFLYVGADRATYALQALTGDIIWKTEDNSVSSSHPAWYENVVFSSSENGNVQAMDANTGEMVWQVNVGNNLDAPVVVGAPLVADGRVHVWGGNAYQALDATDGSIIWQQALGDWLSRFSVVVGIVYGAVDGTLHALAADTGNTLWQFSSGLERQLDRHVVADGVVYVTGQNIYAIDAATGLERWRHPVGDTNMVHTTQIAVGEGRIFSNYESSTLVALGNLAPTVLLTDVAVRGAPSPTAIERGSAQAGDEINNIGNRDSRTGQEWAEVTIGDVTGWIPFEAIDPSTLPPEGDIEYVYVP